MKKYILLVFFFIMSGFFSCGKPCGCVLPPQQPGIAGRLNNAAWEPTLVDTLKNDSLTVYGQRGVDELKLKFKINPTSDAVNEPLTKYDALYTVYPRGPLGRLVYTLDATASNKATLTYGQLEKFLYGNFSLTLKLATPTGNMAFDTTRIYFSTLGFRVRLSK